MADPLEKPPICPACRAPLCGDLVASACNRVYHRKCLAEIAESGSECPQCGELHAASSSLDLFGISFGDALDPGAAALAVKIAQVETEEGGGDSEAGGTKAESLRAAAALLAMKNNVGERKHHLQEQRALIQAERERCAKQDAKLEAAQKLRAARDSDVSQTHKANQQAEIQRKSLLAKLDAVRQQADVSEYWEKLKQDRETEAKQHLLILVNMAHSPAVITAEVSNFQQHTRESLQRMRKDGGIYTQRLQAARRQKAELEADHRRRRGSPPAKRLRL